MPEVREINLDEFAATAMEAAAYAEATRPATVPTGLYRLTYRSHVGQENETGQQWIRFGAVAFRIPKGPDDPFGMERRGSIFFSATPHTYRREDGRLDKMTVLGAQMARAFDINPGNLSAVLLVGAFKAYPLQAFITEVLKNPSGGYENVEYDADGAYTERVLQLLDAGYIPQNFVQNVGKVRA